MKEGCCDSAEVREWVVYLVAGNLVPIFDCCFILDVDLAYAEKVMERHWKKQSAQRRWEHRKLSRMTGYAKKSGKPWRRL